ncbi:hypothetical protein NPIL_545021 [Nephila pilipes]|uniref:Uncharacterized protein n=1 Tax=Nephila pilipes TaxID=299642 RepID=A0A8X6UKN4_NEPPI|nr:hypothetical protein NPIL_545021 [Nephila pilipes]
MKTSEWTAECLDFSFIPGYLAVFSHYSACVDLSFPMSVHIKPVQILLAPSHTCIVQFSDHASILALLYTISHPLSFDLQISFLFAELVYISCLGDFKSRSI